MKYLAITFFFFILLGLLSCSKDEHGISIKTDKKKYSQGEIIEITAINISENTYTYPGSYMLNDDLKPYWIVEYKDGIENEERFNYYCDWVSSNNILAQNIESQNRFKAHLTGTYAYKYKFALNTDTFFVYSNKFKIE